MAAGDELAGAVYVIATPLAVVIGETDPHSMAGQVAPFRVSVQSMLPFDGSLVTVATNSFIPFNATNAEVCERETIIGGALTLILSPTSGDVSGGLPESVT
jgi:hypothetical protein